MMIYGIFMFLIILYVLFFGGGSHMQLRELLLQTFWGFSKKEKKETLWIGTTIFHTKSINIGGVKPPKLLFYPLNPQKQVPIGLLYLKIFATQLKWGCTNTTPLQQLLAFFYYFFLFTFPFLFFSLAASLSCQLFFSLSSLSQSSVYIILLSYVKIKTGMQGKL